MFTRLFEERDKTISRLVKLGDCIGRSLRENVMLFSIDSNNDEVTYLSESRQVISGNFRIDQDVTLSNIKIQESAVFEDGEAFDGFVSDKMHSFIESIHYSEYSDADDTFGDILSLWENRLKLGSIQQRLHEQTERLSEVETILESEAFQNVVEVSPQLINFLSENMDKITQVPEVRNAVNLSNAVSKAFNFPRLTVEELGEAGEYVLDNGVNESIYEMICRQELVKRELLESKRDFETVWATQPAIQELASCIFESDEKTVSALSEAIKEVPYICLASKRSLFDTFSNALGSVEGVTGISEADVKTFSSRIFEYKKEAKEMFVSSLSEKYGVNVQNLSNPASFKSLANTQVVIFEALSRLAPKGSVLKGTLSEMASSLKGKHGVECIDVNDFLLESFVEAGYDRLLAEGETEEKDIDFKRVSKEIKDIENLVTSIKEKLSSKDAAYESDENLEDMPDDEKKKDKKDKKPKDEADVGIKEAADSKEEKEPKKEESSDDSEGKDAEGAIDELGDSLADIRAEEESESTEDDPDAVEDADAADAELEQKTEEEMVDELADLEAIVKDLAGQFSDEDGKDD